METLDQPEKEEPISIPEKKKELHPIGILIIGIILLFSSGLLYLTCRFYTILSNDIGRIILALLIGGTIALLAGFLKLFFKKMRY